MEQIPKQLSDIQSQSALFLGLAKLGNGLAMALGGCQLGLMQGLGVGLLLVSGKGSFI